MKDVFEVVLMDDQVIVGIDIGTTKICTLVGRTVSQGKFQILGVGIEPSQGLRKGVVVDLKLLLRLWRAR